MKKVSLLRFFIIEALFCCFQGLVHPITPTIFKNLLYPDYVFGLVSASTATAMFLFSPAWGNFGDKIGHSRAFSIALPIYSLSQIAFGLSTKPLMSIISRFFSGFSGGGAMVVAMAYVVNITNKENRAKIMSYYAAFNAVSMSMGYFIGGVIGNISISAVFIIQAVALCLASVLTLVFIKDPEIDENKYIYNSSPNFINKFVKKNDAMPKLLRILLIAVFLTSIASYSYDNAFNYYIKADLNLPSTYNGVIKAITGIIGLISNFTINIYLAKKTDLKKSIIVLLFLCGTFALSVPFMPSINTFFILSMVYFALNSIYLPIQQVLVIEDIDEKSCGVISGIFNSVRSVGMIFGSLVVGFLYAIDSKLPFIISSLAFILGAIVCIIYYIRTKIICKNSRKKKGEV